MPDELRRIGAQMANVMYNLAQRPGEPLTPEYVKVMDDLRKQWDAAASGSVLNSITHTAMRSHQCAGCGLTVHAGERYVRAQVPGGGLLAKRAFHSKCYYRLAESIERKGGADVGNISQPR